jgi:regulator of replication initiation timing
MGETWIAILGGAIATILSGFTSWFFTKKRYNAEVDNNLISNMQESLEFYKTLADDNKSRLEEVLAENADLRKEVSDLREQVSKLTSALAEYGLQKLIEEKDTTK